MDDVDAVEDIVVLWHFVGDSLKHGLVWFTRSRVDKYDLGDRIIFHRLLVACAMLFYVEIHRERRS